MKTHKAADEQNNQLHLHFIFLNILKNFRASEDRKINTALAAIVTTLDMSRFLHNTTSQTPTSSRNTVFLQKE